MYEIEKIKLSKHAYEQIKSEVVKACENDKRIKNISIFLDNIECSLFVYRNFNFIKITSLKIFNKKNGYWIDKNEANCPEDFYEEFEINT